MASNSKNRILVTGASGFIGKAVMSELIQHGAEILVASTNPEKVSAEWGIQALDVAHISSDRSTKHVKSFSPQVLVHLGWSRLPDYSVDACLENLALSVELFRVVATHGVTRVVSSGSCWEYGEARGELHETQQMVPNSFFGEAKNYLRQVLDSIGKNSDIETRWARIFYAYGPGQRDQSLIPTSIREWKRGAAPRLRDTGSAIDLVHVQDVARGLASLTLKDGPSGVYNLGSGSATKVSDVVQFIQSSISGSSANLPPIIAQRDNAAWANIQSMDRDFGWKPMVSLAEGIQELI
jgi:dTDP-6-deoxy-L-talose 4-dehydrogenase (NAD+)